MKIKLELVHSNYEIVNEFDYEINKIVNINIDKISQHGFSGIEIVYYFIEFEIIKEFCKLLIPIIDKFIKRNDVKSFKINNIELKKDTIVKTSVEINGYNFNDAKQLLELAMHQDSKK